ncbi:MAG: retropepsin-like aspartic protease [Bacteroides sp.]|jgi:hypothetical protein|nr:retropepsin-like aspartic protease [Bacteroides sp.]
MEIPVRIVEIDQLGYHLLIEGRVNDLKANVLIDTGASRTVIDLNRLNHFFKDPLTREYDKSCAGLGSGQITSYVTVLHSLQLGHKVMKDVEIVAIDLASINTNYAIYDLPRIDMVLGSDLLLKMDACIDYRARKLSLRT